MTDPSPPPRPSGGRLPDPAPTASSSSPAIILSSGEFLWLTFAVWLGGVFILTLTPVLLIPRLGMPLGVVTSYLLFFLAWQPIQIVTQRTFGMRTGVFRMMIFVGGAATLAFYLREALLVLSRG